MNVQRKRDSGILDNKNVQLSIQSFKEIGETKTKTFKNDTKQN